MAGVLIWWFPKMGVPPNHQFFNGIFHCKSILGTPHLGNLHFNHARRIWRYYSAPLKSLLDIHAIFLGEIDVESVLPAKKTATVLVVVRRQTRGIPNNSKHLEGPRIGPPYSVFSEPRTTSFVGLFLG